MTGLCELDAAKKNQVRAKAFRNNQAGNENIA